MGCTTPYLQPFTVTLLYYPTSVAVTPVRTIVISGMTSTSSGWNALPFSYFDVGSGLTFISVQITGIGGSMSVNISTGAGGTGTVHSDSTTGSATLSCGGSWSATYGAGANHFIAPGSTASN